jgi:hypothetical protein
MFDLLFMGIPGLAGVFVLMAAIWFGATTHNAWYVAPAVCGLLAAGSVLGMMAVGPGTSSNIGWISAIFFVLLGLILMWVASKRGRTQRV